jgi:hypothetical protein
MSEERNSKLLTLHRATLEEQAQEPRTLAIDYDWNTSNDEDE